MTKIDKPVAETRRFEFGRVHHYREAEALYEKADASDDSTTVALGRLCMEKLQFSLVKRRTETLARLRRAAATSDPSSLRKLAIYKSHLDGGWNRESINLIYLAMQKDDCLAGYIMSILVKLSGDGIMNLLSLPIADRDALYLDCLQRSSRLGCLGASYDLGCYYGDRGQLVEELRILTQAAEAGYFAAFELLVRRYPSIGSDVYYVDMDAFLSRAKRLACDENDVVTAGDLADYLADDERGALVDRIAALRFHRKSFRKEPRGHTYVVFGDRRWIRDDKACLAWWLLFLMDDSLVSSKHSCFPTVLACKRLQAH